MVSNLCDPVPDYFLTPWLRPVPDYFLMPWLRPVPDYFLMRLQKHTHHKLNKYTIPKPWYN
jgi:hypothetical protein